MTIDLDELEMLLQSDDGRHALPWKFEPSPRTKEGNSSDGQIRPEASVWTIASTDTRNGPLLVAAVNALPGLLQKITGLQSAVKILEDANRDQYVKGMRKALETAGRVHALYDHGPKKILAAISAEITELEK